MITLGLSKIDFVWRHLVLPVKNGTLSFDVLDIGIKCSMWKTWRGVSPLGIGFRKPSCFPDFLSARIQGIQLSISLWIFESQSTMKYSLEINSFVF